MSSTRERRGTPPTPGAGSHPELLVDDPIERLRCGREARTVGSARQVIDLPDVTVPAGRPTRAAVVPARPPTSSGRRSALSEPRLVEEMDRELHRAQIARRTGTLAIVSIAELDHLARRLGSGRANQVAAAFFSGLFGPDAPVLEQHAPRAAGGVYILMPETTDAAGARRLGLLANELARTAVAVDDEDVRVTPVIGYASFTGAATGSELRDHVTLAEHDARLHLDLIPVRYTPGMGERTVGPGTGERLLGLLTDRVRVPLQIAFTLALLVLLPFLVYVLVYWAGFNLTTVTYPLVALALAATAAGLWVESFRAVAPVDLPATPDQPPPTASAIIAAYLPNEAVTILGTVEAMLAQDYPGELQVILAYNTGQHLPIEDVLAERAARDPRLLLLRVPGSTSKAQNVNAALAHVRGEFVGVFDADHHPAPGSFERAWHWIAGGQDVVQGHCVVRNGEASWLARLVAVEFETVYAVSHPGRARLHGFGIFGGSNGYWRSESLRRIRMHGSMLTEDIDSSMRSLLAGLKIVSDPDLISTELAPTTMSALWNQRVRWAQGWTQTARRHLGPALRSPNLTARQKTGAALLLGWTQIIPWVTIQVVPILAFCAWRDGNLGSVDLFVPLFVLLTIFTFSVGPAQAVFGYVLGDRSVRQHRAWFWLYALHSVLWFGELKNLIARVAQVKEVVGERQWRVTPRAVERPATVVTQATIEGERFGRPWPTS